MLFMPSSFYFYDLAFKKKEKEKENRKEKEEKFSLDFKVAKIYVLAEW